MKIPKGERRSLKQIREQYEIERELSDRLRNAEKEKRRFLYTELYNELYRRVPHHRQLTRKTIPELRIKNVTWQVRLLKHFLRSEFTFLEVGPGDCSLAFEVAKYVTKVYAVDVSEEITKDLKYPGNFELIISDGSSIPVPVNSVDMVYSNQLIEHLHPDDTNAQLQNIYNVLKAGGIYFLITPNQLFGPHDISKYFDEVATGFHLKEYTNTELAIQLKKIGFSRVRVFINLKGKGLLLPIFPVRLVECVLKIVPRVLRNTISSKFPVRLLINVMLVAKK
ncbi:MAG: class I SAM-dependent methyltransferase [Planctomycetota bacterium]|jgi:SAM-dependent methyltransferase